MHPIYQLKETGLVEDHQNWIGREVRDHYGRHLGHVKEILVEERTWDDAVREDKDPQAWTARADFVVVSVEAGLLDRIHARHTVVLPVEALQDKDGRLVVDEDRDDIRVALGA